MSDQISTRCSGKTLILSLSCATASCAHRFIHLFYIPLFCNHHSATLFDSFIGFYDYAVVFCMRDEGYCILRPVHAKSNRIELNGRELKRKQIRIEEKITTKAE